MSDRPSGAISSEPVWNWRVWFLWIFIWGGGALFIWWFL